LELAAEWVMVNFDTYSAEHPELFKDDVEPGTPTSSRNANSPSPMEQQELENEPDFTSFHLGFTYDFHPSLSDVQNSNNNNINNANPTIPQQTGRAATAQGSPPAVIFHFYFNFLFYYLCPFVFFFLSLLVKTNYFKGSKIINREIENWTTIVGCKSNRSRLG